MMALTKSLARIFLSGNRACGVAVFLGVLIVFLQYNPVWLDAGHVFFGDKDDGNLCFFVYNWGLETIGKGNWSQFWNPPFFHPNTQVSAYTENTLLPVVLGLVPYWISGSALVSYNAVIFINLVLFFIGIFLLGSVVSGSRKAGLFAALCGICADYLMVQSGHAQNLFIGFVPFIFLFLFNWYTTFRMRYAWFCVAALSATCWSNLYYFTFCLFLCAVAAACFLVARQTTISRRVVAQALLPGAVAFISVLPVLYPYFSLAGELSEQRGKYFVPFYYSANLLEFIGVRKFSTNWETTVFMGPVLTCLVAFSIWYWFYRARNSGWKWRTILRPAGAIDNLHLAGIFIIILGVAAVVACGPAIRLGSWWIINPNPFYAAYYYLAPGAHGTRAIGRIMLMAIPLFSVVCAEGLWAAVRDIRKKGAVLGIAAVFVFSTSQFVPTAFGSALLKTDIRDLRRPDERMVSWFRSHEKVTAIALFPIAGATPGDTGNVRDKWESENLWFAHILNRPIINGYSGYFPPSYATMDTLWKKEGYRFSNALAGALAALHVNTIIVDRGLLKDFQISSVHPRFRFQSEASGDTYAVFTVE
jgi:hypothetical protein